MAFDDQYNQRQSSKSLHIKSTSSDEQFETPLENAVDARLLLNTLFDHAGAIIIATDPYGIINFFNPEAIACLGFDRKEVGNLHTPVLFHDKTEIAKKRDLLLKEFGEVIENDFDVLVEKARRNIHLEEEYTYIRKDRTTFPVVLTITAIRNCDDTITGFMGIAIDITDRKKAEGLLLESLKKEKELGELKSNFVTLASHEFRTPLSIILSSAYLIGKHVSESDQPKREKHLERIFASVKMLTDILNDFLSVGKIEEGKIQVRPALFNVRQLINEMSAQLNDTMKKQQKIMMRHTGEEEITLDPSLLKHILLNLVSNASKFSPEESPIEISTVCDDNGFLLSVRDYGIGIPKEDQLHLMERFFRGNNTGNVQGTGLGLHITGKYVELMNGKMECKSEPGKGTQFILTFPYKQFV